MLSFSPCTKPQYRPEAREQPHVHCPPPREAASPPPGENRVEAHPCGDAGMLWGLRKESARMPHARPQSPVSSTRSPLCRHKGASALWWRLGVGDSEGTSASQLGDPRGSAPGALQRRFLGKTLFLEGPEAESGSRGRTRGRRRSAGAVSPPSRPLQRTILGFSAALVGLARTVTNAHAGTRGCGARPQGPLQPRSVSQHTCVG